MSHRAFFALWPDPDLRSRIAAIRDRHAGPGRDVPVAHLHLTLAFAGSIDEATLMRLQHAASGIALPGFTLTLDRLDAFAAAGVQWLGPSMPPDALSQLAVTLQQCCRAVGVALPDAGFRPHVTLRRQVRHPERGRVPALRWPAHDFTLIESGRCGRPGRYRVLARWPLGPASDG